MKNVLVLGGNRFFGIHLVNALLEKNYDVTIANRGIAQDPFGNRVTRILFDRYNEGSIIENIGSKEFDVVFDNIAYASNDVDILLANIICRKYIMTSSMAVYDPLIGVLHEDAFKPEIYQFSNLQRNQCDYAEGKRVAEAAVIQKYQKVKPICVRLPFVIGRDDYTERLYEYINCFLLKKELYIDNMMEKMSFIDSKEAGDFLAFLVEKEGFVGGINAASNGTISMHEVLCKVNNATMNNIESLYNNAQAKKAPYNGVRGYTIDTSLAQKLGYSFTDINDWIENLVNYYVNRVKK